MAMAHLSPEQKIREALEARDALVTALTAAGIQLPAMDVRTPWLGDLDSDDVRAAGQGAGSGGGNVGGEGSRRARYALVHLGVCSAPVAHALAEVIARGAAR